MTHFTDQNERLAEFYALDPGWYWGTGRPVPELAKIFAQSFAATRPELFETSSVYPVPDGGLSFEWDKPEITVRVLAEYIEVYDFTSESCERDMLFDGICDELLAEIDKLFAKESA